MDEGEDFKLDNSGTATTNAIWDMVLPCIEWSIKTILSLHLNINTYFIYIHFSF